MSHVSGHQGHQRVTSAGEDVISQVDRMTHLVDVSQPFPASLVIASQAREGSSCVGRDELMDEMEASFTSTLRGQPSMGNPECLICRRQKPTRS